jgi:hypothetical protein
LRPHAIGSLAVAIVQVLTLGCLVNHELVPESTSQAALTIGRLGDALPN